MINKFYLLNVKNHQKIRIETKNRKEKFGGIFHKVEADVDGCWL